MFATAVAEAVGLRRVHLFALGTVFSAYGSAISDVLHVYERALTAKPEVAALTAAAQNLIEQAQRDLRGEGFDPAAASYHWTVQNAARERAETTGDVACAAVTLVEALPDAGLLRLDARYAVHPVEISPSRPILFARAPGTGKASVMARLAARAVSQGVSPLLVSCDQRAGAGAQMQTYAKALHLDFETAPGARELDLVLGQAAGRPVFIDTGGVNPFDLDALESLTYLAATADAEIIAVMEAGQIPADAEDAAALFASIGAARVIFTRLDIARRMGALLAAGEAGFSYAHIAASPFIGSGLAPATPLRLARALLEDPTEDGPE